MTVRELIEELTAFPPETPVVYICCSDVQPLNAGDVRLSLAKDKFLVLRGGHYCRDYPRAQYPPGESPQYVTLVVFPGN